MDFNLILTRVLGILTKPAKEWEIIKGESTSIKDLYLKFACIVFALPSLFIFLAYLFSVGFNGFFSTLLLTVISYIFVLGGVFLVGILIDVVAPQFGGTKDLLNSQKLAVYSLIPFALAGLIFIFQFGGTLSIISWYLPMLVLGLPYPIYLVYVGAPILKNISKEKLAPFTIITGIIFFVVFNIAFYLSFKIYWQMMWGRALSGYQNYLGN